MKYGESTFYILYLIIAITTCILMIVVFWKYFAGKADKA